MRRLGRRLPSNMVKVFRVDATATIVEVERFRLRKPDDFSVVARKRSNKAVTLTRPGALEEKLIF